jgi:hypothetical protein
MAQIGRHKEKTRRQRGGKATRTEDFATNDRRKRTAEPIEDLDRFAGSMKTNQIKEAERYQHPRSMCAAGGGGAWYFSYWVLPMHS